MHLRVSSEVRRDGRPAAHPAATFTGKEVRRAGKGFHRGVDYQCGMNIPFVQSIVFEYIEVR